METKSNPPAWNAGNFVGNLSIVEPDRENAMLSMINDRGRGGPSSTSVCAYGHFMVEDL